MALLLVGPFCLTPGSINIKINEGIIRFTQATLRGNGSAQRAVSLDLVANLGMLHGCPRLVGPCYHNLGPCSVVMAKRRCQDYAAETCYLHKFLSKSPLLYQQEVPSLETCLTHELENL